MSQLSSDTGIKEKYWVLLAVGIGTLMSALDGSVVNTVLPVIEKNFSSKVSVIEWTVVIYLLVVTSLLLTFGRLGDLRGHKPIYLLGFVLFIAGSIACGLAINAGSLIAFRAIQAIGAAMLFSNAPAIITSSFPAAQRGQAFGLQGIMTYLGLVMGPILGGYLTQQYGWRYVFFINIPIGLIAFVLSVVFVPRDRVSEKQETFDLLGAIIFMLGLISLLLSLDMGSELGWTSTIILGLVGFAILMVVAFIYIESKILYPMLDLSLFSKRIFTTGTVSAVINYIGLYSVIFLTPFYLIQGRGLNPAQAGMLLTTQAIVMVVTAPVSGIISDKIGSRLLSTVGMLLLATGLFILSRYNAQTPIYHIVYALILTGAGTGMFASPNTSAIMGSSPKNRQGIASGILATARNLGMVLGVGISAAILTTGTSQSSNHFYLAIQTGFLVSSIIVIAGSFTSGIRGSEDNHAHQ
jgi:EmrB/QacA subfamily drug resistance transporter